MSAFSKLTQVGRRRGADRRPVAADRADRAARGRATSATRCSRRCDELMRAYRETLEHDRRVLLEEFGLTDFARKVVGVGSVGTRAWIALLLGRDGQDPLFLQMKEAEASVLEEFLGPSEFAEPRRAGRHRAAADAGHQRHLPRLAARRPEGSTAKPRDFYGRQLKDWKGSAEIEQMVPKGMAHVRQAVRLDARARARPQRRPDRDRRLPRQRRHLRPRDPRVLQRLRRAERARLPAARRGGQVRADHRRDRALTAASSTRHRAGTLGARRASGARPGRGVETTGADSALASIRHPNGVFAARAA